MRTQVLKWGNSLGVRIPKAYAKDADLSDGATVEMKLSGRKLAMTPAQPAYELQALVAGITPENRHGETDWGNPKG